MTNQPQAKLATRDGGSVSHVVRRTTAAPGRVSEDDMSTKYHGNPAAEGAAAARQDDRLRRRTAALRKACRKDAEAAYTFHALAVTTLLDQIQSELAEHEADRFAHGQGRRLINEKVTKWTAVGDLQHVRGRLTEIYNFLTQNEDENAGVCDECGRPGKLVGSDPIGNRYCEACAD